MALHECDTNSLCYYSWDFASWGDLPYPIITEIGQAGLGYTYLDPYALVGMTPFLDLDLKRYEQELNWSTNKTPVLIYFPLISLPESGYSTYGDGKRYSLNDTNTNMLTYSNFGNFSYVSSPTLLYDISPGLNGSIKLPSNTIPTSCYNNSGGYYPLYVKNTPVGFLSPACPSDVYNATMRQLCIKISKIY